MANGNSASGYTFFIDDLWKDIEELCHSDENFEAVKYGVYNNTELSKFDELDVVLRLYKDLKNNEARIFIEENGDLNERLSHIEKTSSSVKIYLNDTEDIVRDLEQENESLRNLFKEKDVSESTLNKAITQRSREDFDSAGKADSAIERLKAEIRLLKQELTIVHDTSFVHKEATAGKINDSFSKLQFPDFKNKMEVQNIAKAVNNLVPLFSGTEGPELQAEVYKFIQGTDLAVKTIQTGQFEIFMNCVKQRLHGDAFSLVNSRRFEKLEELHQLIKNTYLRVRSLESVQHEIKHARQRPGEDLRPYARRLEALCLVGQNIVRSNYDDNGNACLIKELEKSVCITFKVGVLDKELKGFLLCATGNNLDELVRQAIEAEAVIQEGKVTNTEKNRASIHCNDADTDTSACLYSQSGEAKQPVGPSQSRVQFSDRPYKKLFMDNEAGNRNLGRGFPAQNVLPCSFCKKLGHARNTCFKRLNTPYCDRCAEYGHEPSRRCDVEERGQSWDKRMEGRQDVRRNEIGGGRPGGDIVNPFRNANGRPTNYSSSNNLQRNCFWCGKPGHMVADCVEKKNWLRNQGNSRGPNPRQ